MVTCSDSSSVLAPLKFSFPPSSIWVLSGKRVREFCSYVVLEIISKLFWALFTFLVALMGIIVGALIGVLIGRKTKSGLGLFLGAISGAVSGALFSVEVFRCSVAVWHSDISENAYLLCLANIVGSLLRRKTPIVGQSENIPDASSRRLRDRQSSRSTISPEIMGDVSWDTPTCCVCLQEFQNGEVLRSLPRCHHEFHGSCIEKWLKMQRTCPLCRRML